MAIDFGQLYLNRVNEKELVNSFSQRVISGHHISGHHMTMAIIDEWGDFWGRPSLGKIPIPPRVVARYENKDVPDATIEIVEEKSITRRDPRNPNPAAGDIKVLILKRNGKRIGNTFGSVGAAKMKAKVLHDTLVAAVLKQRAEALEQRIAGNPLYGKY